jgi:signal recognition particle subunit SRP54
MFDNFSQKITKIFDNIAGKKSISESDFEAVTRQIRIAFLEADVSLSVAKEFINKIKEEAIGKQVIKNVNAGQMIIKIINDELVKLLGSDKSEIDFNHKPPIIILMAGLQASGKTTSSAKIALHLKKKYHKRIMLASLDVYRPAAREQLEILAKKIDVLSLPIIEDAKPLEIASNAIDKAKEFGCDVLILDSAGRTTINQEMMDELVAIKNLVNPHETLLVVDAMIGQDAVNIAQSFKNALDLTGIVLTRLDGDSRGGAALTMREVTKCPIKFVGVGEKIEDLEEFNPKGIASRIVGMGDVVALVEKAQDIFDKDEMEKSINKINKGKFDFNDLLSQIRQMKKMGGLGKIVNLLPGSLKIKEKLANMTHFEKEIIRQEALILSMTKQERANPDILNSSRKNRIAKGAGSNIQEVNRLLKKYKQMQKMLKKFGKIDPNQLKELANNQDFSKFNL